MYKMYLVEVWHPCIYLVQQINPKDVVLCQTQTFNVWHMCTLAINVQYLCN
jgi:hypothetical protein